MSEIRVDTVSEKTSANGVSIDGVTLKDNGITISQDISHLDNAGTSRILYDRSENLLGNTGTNLQGATLFIGGTGSANQLDDYEEGTWTPVISADATPTAYATQVGVYTKVGRQVTVIFTFNISTIGSFAGAAVKVTGFPFAAGDHSTHTFGTLFLDGTASEVQAAGDLGIKLSNNTSQALFQGNSGNVSGDNNINANKIDTGTFIHGTITYFTD